MNNNTECRINGEWGCYLSAHIKDPNDRNALVCTRLSQFAIWMCSVR